MSVSSTEGHRPPSPTRRWGPLALATLLALGWFAVSTGRNEPALPVAVEVAPELPEPPRVSRRAIAIGAMVGGGNADSPWIGNAVAEILELELRAREQLRVVPAEDVLLAGLTNPAGSEPDATELRRLHAATGADYLVHGRWSLTSGGDPEVRLELRLDDALTVARTAEAEAVGSRSELLDVVGRAFSPLLAALGEPSDVASDALLAGLPEDPDVAGLYSRGQERLRAGDAATARDLLEQASLREPGNVLIQAALADAWSALGYRAKALGAAQRAFDRAGKLPRERRWLIEARLRQLSGEWQEAADIYRTLFLAFPDGAEYGFELARALIPAGQRDEALRTLTALRGFPPPVGTDPRLDLIEAQAAQALGDLDRALAAARRAAASGEARGVRLLTARARMEQGVALRDLGLPEPALAQLDVAATLFEEEGHRAGFAEALRYRGTVLRRHGDLLAAREAYERSLAVSEQIRDWTGIAYARSQLAVLLRQQGDLAGARDLHEKLLVGHREVEDRDGAAVTLNNLGYVLRRLGDLPAARVRIEEALTLERESANLQGQAVSLNILGWLELEAGDVEEARAAFSQTLEMARRAGNRRSEGFSLYGLGEVALIVGDLGEARRSHEQALRVREQIGETGTAVASRLALAGVAVESGDSARAEEWAREAAHHFEEQAERDDEAQALSLLVRCLAAQGRLAEAEAAMKRADALASRSQAPSVRLAADHAFAVLRLSSGVNVTEAVGRLTAARELASRHGLALLEFRGRELMGLVELRFGDPRAGRAILDALGDEARRRGLEGLAERATLALSDAPEV